MHRGNSPGWLRDGNLTFSGGVDGSRPESSIGRDQLETAINCTMRGGPVKPRPGWKQRKLTFAHGCKTPFEGGFWHKCAAVYNGDTFNSCLSSQGGRQFKVDIESGATITRTTADFTIPAVGANVNVSVADTSNLQSQSSDITIGNYLFVMVSINSSTQITVQNATTANVGLNVAHPANVLFLGTWQVTEITPVEGAQTATTANFTIPAVGATVNVSVLNGTAMAPNLPAITIGGYTFELITVNSATSITVLNNEAANVGIVVAQPAVVMFTVYDLNDPNQQLNWSERAENYWLVQDNQSNPIVFDGSKSHRSDPRAPQVAGTIPVGNVMCYAMGRISVALPDRKSYRVGDLVFGQSGTQAKAYRDAILHFSENDYLNEGGALVARVFGAPSNSGNITSMKAGAMSDTALGQGPMLVGTPNMIFSVNLPFDRTTWKNLASALQTANPIKGPVSQDSVVLINTDLWYRCNDRSFRSYITAQRQFNGSPGNTSQSNEIDDMVSEDTQEWLEFGSGVYFDNRYLHTISPQMSPHGVYHRGLAVLDFDLTTNIRSKAPPAWEGIWTGKRILQIIEGIVNGAPRCFMYVLNDSSQIELWEMSTSDKDDDGNPIQWEPVSPAYHCGDNDQLKRLVTGRLILANLWGTLEGVVKYRTDEAACWNNWTSFNVCAQNEDCAAKTCPNSGPITYVTQPRFPVRMTEPPDDFDPISRRKLCVGYEHQMRFIFVGYAELRSLRIFCLPEPENLGLERTDFS